MRTLSDTISRLGAMRDLPGFATGDASTDRLGDVAMFGPNPGALRARIYIPDNLPANAPLVVVLHGCTQAAASYDHGSGWSRLADSHGFALLFPEQQRANNTNLCFNWFIPEDVRRDSGEAASIRAMVGYVLATYALDPARVFVTGLSAGGAMTSVMLATYPDVFAGGAIIAGLPYGSARSVPEAFDRMRGSGGPDGAGLAALVRGASSHRGPWPTVSVWQGSADHTVAAANAALIVDQWRGVHGLDAAPTKSETVGRYPRRVWCNADGRAVIEEYSITGMGHGTPLETGGADGYGASGAHMLDVGISSTRRIAAFWELTDALSAGESAPVTSIAEEPTKPSSRIWPKPRLEASATPTGVGKVIEDALRAAGLMR